jgi:uncharacterized protein YegL
MSELTGPRRPGGRMASRPLHFIWLADGSGSMRVQGKIKALNEAISEAIPHMQMVARENPQASVFVNAIHFSDEARWMEERLTPVSEFRWQNIEAGGATALGEALTMVGDVLQPPLMTDRALPPVIALVTDGLPTDDFQAGLNHLFSKTWGRRAKRIVIAIGEDSASDEAKAFFRAFTENDSIKPFQANNPEALKEAVRWVSTGVLKSVASPLTQVATGPDSEPAVEVASFGIENENADEADLW